MRKIGKIDLSLIGSIDSTGTFSADDGILLCLTKNENGVYNVYSSSYNNIDEKTKKYKGEDVIGTEYRECARIGMYNGSTFIGTREFIVFDRIAYPVAEEKSKYAMMRTDDIVDGAVISLCNSDGGNIGVFFMQNGKEAIRLKELEAHIGINSDIFCEVDHTYIHDELKIPLGETTFESGYFLPPTIEESKDILDRINLKFFDTKDSFIVILSGNEEIYVFLHNKETKELDVVELCVRVDKNYIIEVAKELSNNSYYRDYCDNNMDEIDELDQNLGYAIIKTIKDYKCFNINRIEEMVQQYIMDYITDEAANKVQGAVRTLFAGETDKDNEELRAHGLLNDKNEFTDSAAAYNYLYNKYIPEFRSFEKFGQPLLCGLFSRLGDYEDAKRRMIEELRDMIVKRGANFDEMIYTNVRHFDKP